MNQSIHVVCPHCGTTNKLPAGRLGEGPACGKCKRALFAGEPVNLDAAAFARHAERSDLPLVVDFWAPWCAPCGAMAPAFAQAARAFEPHCRLAKVNTEAEPDLAARFGIRSIPTVAIFRHGRELARQSGAMDAATLSRWISAHAGTAAAT